MNTVQWSTVELPKISDVRGNLTAIESNRTVPFHIERVYYIYDVPSGSTRAGHAHRALHQLFLALSGSFSIHLDNCVTKTTISLNRPHIGLYVPPGVWRVIDDFSAVAFASCWPPHLMTSPTTSGLILNSKLMSQTTPKLPVRAKPGFILHDRGTILQFTKIEQRASTRPDGCCRTRDRWRSRDTGRGTGAL